MDNKWTFEASVYYANAGHTIVIRRQWPWIVIKRMHWYYITYRYRGVYIKFKWKTIIYLCLEVSYYWKHILKNIYYKYIYLIKDQLVLKNSLYSYYSQISALGYNNKKPINYICRTCKNDIITVWRHTAHRIIHDHVFSLRLAVFDVLPLMFMNTVNNHRY